MEAIPENIRLDDPSEASESASPARSEDFDRVCSSRSDSTVSYNYEYDPNDFPRLNEIEEFPAPSFSWASSRSVSGRYNSPRSAAIPYNKNWPKKLAVKLQMDLEVLDILVSLTEVAPVAVLASPERMQVIEEAQQTLAKASGNTPNLKEDWNEMVQELQTAVSSISTLLPKIKVALAKLIQLARHVAKTADRVQYTVYKGYFQKLKSKSERLATVLWVAAGNNDLYERPLSQIIVTVEKILFKAAKLFSKYSNKILVDLEDCIMAVSWVNIRLSKSSYFSPADYENVLPYVVQNKILCSIWEAIATLVNSSPEGIAEAVETLMSLASENDEYGKMIIEEGGKEPLLKLAKERGAYAQESAIKTIGYLCRELKNAKKFIEEEDGNHGIKICSVLISVLNDGPTPVQANVAWAISRMANHYGFIGDSKHLSLTAAPLAKCLQDKCMSAMKSDTDYDEQIDLFIAMAVKALTSLFDKNSSLIHRIAIGEETSSLMLLLPNFLHKGSKMLRGHTAQLLRVIAHQIENDNEFKTAFDEIDQAGTNLINQLLRVVSHVNSDGLLLPCITALGCLSVICTTTDVIAPLVYCLNYYEVSDDTINGTAVTALNKLIRNSANHMSKSYCETIVKTEGCLASLKELAFIRQPYSRQVRMLANILAPYAPDDKDLNDLARREHVRPEFFI